MKKLYNIKTILTCLVFFVITLGLQAQESNVLSQARIFIDAGHGGWGSNDRPLPIIGFTTPRDTMAFFESRSNLWRALALRDELKRAGAGYVFMNRTVNGIFVPTDANPTGSPGALVPEIPNGTVVDGQVQQIILSVIARNVEENNIDYFLSIHSDAAGNPLTNHLVILFRGHDNQVGNGLVYARDMGRAAWPYLHANEMTVFGAHLSPLTPNVRGDMSFMGSSGSTTTPIPGGTAYTGHFAVLRHGADGFLSEGGFHTNDVERHRKMNRDYARQFGVRYSRAIRSWFGDDTETQGSIMGSFKDSRRSKIHPLFQFRPGTTDAHFPLNNAVVILQDESGNELNRYTTDSNWNGIFVFHPLDVGRYRLVFEPIPELGFDGDYYYIDVVANQTSFVNFTMRSIRLETPEVLSVVPADGSQVEASTDIVLRFNVDMDLESVTNAFSIYPPVEGTFIFENENYTMRFRPNFPLEVSTTYTIRLATTAKHPDNLYLEEEFVSTFTTGDRNRLLLLESNPSAETQRMGTNPNFYFIFDRRVNATSAREGIRLLDEDGNRVNIPAIRIQVNTNNVAAPLGDFRFTLAANQRLQEGRTYRIVIDGTVIDNVGIPLLYPIEFSFVAGYGVQTPEHTSQPIRVYPNPVSDVLFVQTDSNETPLLQLFSLTGQLLREVRANEISVQGLSAGTYVLVVNTGKEIHRKPIIVR